MTLSLSRRQIVAGSAAVVTTLAAVGLVGRPTAAAAGPILPGALKEDLALWRRAVLERHPRFFGQTRLDDPAEAAFKAAEAAFDQAMSHRQAFAILGRLNPFLRDAHTLLLPWLSGEAPNEEETKRQFPFGIDVKTNARLRLRSGWVEAGTGRKLDQGSEILAINGLSSSDVLKRLQPYGHGETDKLQLHMLSVMMPEWLDAVMGWRDRFAITLSNGGAAQNLTLTRSSQWKPVTDPALADMPSVEWLDDGAALMRIPTFDVDEHPEVYNQAVDAAFAKIRAKGISRLLLDVRGNTGGQSDAGAKVIRYFLDRPRAQASRARERLNSDNNGVMGYRGEPGSMIEFDLEEKMMQPLDPALRFTGQVAVLIDELTYSAGILFATTMQDLKLARLVGRPTGGFANQSGNMMPTRLPSTGFTAFIATRDFIRPNGDARVHPVQPDVVVADDATDADVIRAALATGLTR